ncbi:MAG: MltR family transcriptional regulator [Rhizomicrobium sp.]
MSGQRATPKLTISEVFHFGIFEDDKRGRYDDRAIALVTGAAIEQALESAILTKFIKLDEVDERYLFSDENAPLSTFDAKIRVAYALGVIGKLARDDLVCIKQIRNSFAHSRLDINFYTPEIVSAVAQLTLPSRIPHLFSAMIERDFFIQTGYQYFGSLISAEQTELDDKFRNHRAQILA